jgi:hypothetical protein
MLGLNMFNHEKAQRYEIRGARKAIRKDFPGIWEAWQQERERGGLWHSAGDPWFQEDTALFSQFVEHVRNKKCLEIGSGPFGFLGPAYWIKDRVIIDPLINAYRDEELQLLGQTFFTEEIETIPHQAETFVEGLSVDGCIVCRNALDHCEDPLTVLGNIGSYAAPGCYLLLWTDIWHLQDLDAGHKNITRSATALETYIKGLGFEVVKRMKKIRNPEEFVEYGCLAQKLPH